MAIGINKHEHRLLMERITRLIEQETDPAYWIGLQAELKGSYDALFQAVQDVENKAQLYRVLCRKIRPLSAHAMRRKKVK